MSQQEGDFPQISGQEWIIILGGLAGLTIALCAVRYGCIVHILGADIVVRDRERDAWNMLCPCCQIRDRVVAPAEEDDLDQLELGDLMMRLSHVERSELIDSVLASKVRFRSDYNHTE